MLAKYEICCGIFHGFDWSSWEDPSQRLALLPLAQNYILAKRDGARYFIGVKTRNEMQRGGARLNDAYNLVLVNDAKNRMLKRQGKTSDEIIFTMTELKVFE